MKEMRRPGVAIALIAVALWFATGSHVEAQKAIRIGASVSLTGEYAELGQARHRGYQLCVKHTNEKGGVLGRKLELVMDDDRSETATAVRIYEKLIARDKVDVILGPYSSPINDAVADVNEKHRIPMVTTGAAAPSIFKKGRKFMFMVPSPAETYLEGLIDLAARKGLKTMAILNEDTLFPKATAQGAAELAKRKDSR